MYIAYMFNTFLASYNNNNILLIYKLKCYFVYINDIFL